MNDNPRKRTEEQKLADRDAAKARIKEWWDKPEHKPTKDEDERTRDDAVPHGKGEDK